MNKLSNIICFQKAQERQIAKRFSITEGADYTEEQSSELVEEMINKLNILISSFEAQDKTSTVSTSIDNAIS